MHVFISAGEPSGDLHGANLIRELNRLDPTIRVSGFGGDRMAAAGCRVALPALQALGDVVPPRRQADLHTSSACSTRPKRSSGRERPDAGRADRLPRLPLAAGRSGRKPRASRSSTSSRRRSGRGPSGGSSKMRRLMTHVLSALPFEHEWLAERGVRSTYIGHPYFDELAAQVLDESSSTAERGSRAGSSASCPARGTRR